MRAVGGMIRVLIVDDHQVVSDSLGGLLTLEEDIVVVATATTAEEGLRVAIDLQPDVALVDFELPDGDGALLTGRIKRAAPDVKVIMLTAHTDERVMLSAIEAGCSGFLTKDRAAVDVVVGVRAVAAGEAHVPPGMLMRLLPKLTRSATPTIGDSLTDREREVLALLATGRPNREIAEQLHLSLNTVRNYVQSILSKLDAHSKLEAVAIAVRERIILR